MLKKGEKVGQRGNGDQTRRCFQVPLRGILEHIILGLILLNLNEAFNKADFSLLLGSPFSLSRRPRFNPWVRKFPWRRVQQPILVLLPEEFHGQRSLVGLQSMESQRAGPAERLTLTLSDTACDPLPSPSRAVPSRLPLLPPPYLPVYIGLSLQSFCPYLFAVTVLMISTSPTASNNIQIRITTKYVSLACPSPLYSKPQYPNPYLKSLLGNQICLKYQTFCPMQNQVPDMSSPNLFFLWTLSYIMATLSFQWIRLKTWKSSLTPFCSTYRS